MSKTLYKVAIALFLSLYGSNVGAQNKAKSVEVNDCSAVNGKKTSEAPDCEKKYYEVVVQGNKYIVVIAYYNKSREKFWLTKPINLDENNEFQPVGMRWKFTVTSDGYLVWEEVSN